MLEEGDPLATALLAQYKDIPMPNLRLTDGDVEKLLGYIDQESRRIGELRAAAGAAEHDGHHGGRGEPAAHAAHGEHAARSAAM